MIMIEQSSITIELHSLCLRIYMVTYVMGKSCIGSTNTKADCLTTETKILTCVLHKDAGRFLIDMYLLKRYFTVILLD